MARLCTPSLVVLDPQGSVASTLKSLQHNGLTVGSGNECLGPKHESLRLEDVATKKKRQLKHQGIIDFGYPNTPLGASAQLSTPPKASKSAGQPAPKLFAG